MHSAFLYYAISQGGMDMGIVNAGKLPLYMDIDEELRNLLGEVIMNQSQDNEECVDKLINYAKAEKERLDQEKLEKKGEPVIKQKKVDEWRTKSVEERLSYALVKGIIDYVEKDAEEAR
mmetsp:Transcript_19989/g.18980  ORF Transcript_19989/g.18980 Transcript_19989/m.18980 type:complete len:119 (-) Transcript_19989:46-402(-)